jgi:hypothetical protein
VTAPDRWTPADEAWAWAECDEFRASPSSLAPMLDATFEPDDEYDDLRPSIFRWLASLMVAALLGWLVVAVVVFAAVAVVSWAWWFVEGVLARVLS